MTAVFLAACASPEDGSGSSGGLACPTPTYQGAAETCGNGQDEAGELCLEVTAPAPPPALAMAGDVKRYSAVHDVDDDGRLEVIVATGDAPPILLELEAGALVANAMELPAGSRAQTVGHFQGATELSLVVARNGSGEAEIVRLERSDAGWEEVETLIPNLQGGDCVFADFDSDDLDDLVCTHSGGLRIWLGGETEPREVEGEMGRLVPRQVVSDVDEDGHPDLLVWQASGTWLYRGDGSAPLADGEPLPHDLPQLYFAGDIDGDGHVDLASEAPGDPSPEFLAGDGQGGFVPTEAALESCAGVTYVDLTGDGIAEALVEASVDGSDLETTVWIVHNDGQGAPAGNHPVASARGLAVVRTVDLNADGHLDVLLADFGSDAFIAAVHGP